MSVLYLQAGQRGRSQKPHWPWLMGKSRMRALSVMLVTCGCAHVTETVVKTRIPVTFASQPHHHSLGSMRVPEEQGPPRVRTARSRGPHTPFMKLKRKEEGLGNNPRANMFVDRSCSSCGACAALCPGVFSGNGLRTVVQRDPLSKDEKLWAYRAMVACPSGAIRLRKPDPYVKEVVETGFPFPVDEEELPGVMQLGYRSKDSMGGAPYLVIRPGGNLMIDTPRFNGRLAAQIEKLGGVRYNVMTDEGSAPDHDMWKAFFPNSTRIVHRRDVTRHTNDAEVLLNGKGPWTLDDDIMIIHLEGQTPGSIGVIHKGAGGEGVLFSGRTIGWSPQLGRLDGFAQLSSGSISQQAASIRSLTDQNFAWILPAQGMKYRFPNPDKKGKILSEASANFEQRGRGTLLY